MVFPGSIFLEQMSQLYTSSAYESSSVSYSSATSTSSSSSSWPSQLSLTPSLTTSLGATSEPFSSSSLSRFFSLNFSAFSASALFLAFVSSSLNIFSSSLTSTSAGITVRSFPGMFILANSIHETICSRLHTHEKTFSRCSSSISRKGR